MQKVILSSLILFLAINTYGQNSEITDFVSEKLNESKNIDRIDSIAKSLGIKPGGYVSVNVAFEIDEKGEINILMIKSPHPVFDEEAKKILNLLPKMKPAIKNGKPIAVKYLLPIKFVIETEKEKEKRLKKEERKRKRGS